MSREHIIKHENIALLPGETDLCLITNVLYQYAHLTYTHFAVSRRASLTFVLPEDMLAEGWIGETLALQSLAFLLDVDNTLLDNDAIKHDWDQQLQAIASPLFLSSKATMRPMSCR